MKIRKEKRKEWEWSGLLGFTPFSIEFMLMEADFEGI
jgi:hypothetical protein